MRQNLLRTVIDQLSRVSRAHEAARGLQEAEMFIDSISQAWCRPIRTNWWRTGRCMSAHPSLRDCYGRIEYSSEQGA